MKLKVAQSAARQHKEMVTAVGWTATTPPTLLSCSDDKTIASWATDGKDSQTVCTTDCYGTDLELHPLAAKAGPSVFVLAGSDGKYRIMNTGGKVDKLIDAHKGAITCIRWNREGTAIATAGEDGFVKQWSSVGRLRSKLTQADAAVYSMAWSPEDQAILYCAGKFMVVKPLNPNQKPNKWKAHDGTVLKVDWNPNNNLIVSAGEDCKYKIWDPYGRLLFSSTEMEYPVTCVSWSPSGNSFAAGSFNSLMLCDKTGWTHSRESTESGSIMAMSWTPDGTQLAAAGANGHVLFTNVVDVTIEWDNYEATLAEDNQVVIRDVLTDQVEELEFGSGGQVVDISMAFGYLIVVTSTQCYVYSVQHLGTPHVFDVRGGVSLILQSSAYFALVNVARGLEIHSYDSPGRVVSQPRVQGMIPKLLKRGNTAMSSDVVAVIDRTNKKQIHLLDVTNGKAIADPIVHPDGLDIVEISLSQANSLNNRKLAYIDSNRDLYLALVVRVQDAAELSSRKLAGAVDTMAWHEQADILAAVANSSLNVWYNPNSQFVDSDLMNKTKHVFPRTDDVGYGSGSTLVSFSGSRVVARKSDGKMVAAMIPPFFALLHRCAGQGQWTKAIRLCRAAKDPQVGAMMFACLAATALQAQELEAAEIALAAVDEVDKVEFLQMVMDIPSLEGRNAELALFRRRPEDAENILVQAGLIYRAVMLNIRLFKWSRALELALKYKTHVDTVLAYRQRHIQAMRKSEYSQQFIELNQQVPIDWNAIQAKQESEVEKERARGTAYRRKFGGSSVPDMKTSTPNNANFNQAPLRPLRQLNNTGYSGGFEPPPEQKQQPPPLQEYQEPEQEQHERTQQPARRVRQWNPQDEDNATNYDQPDYNDTGDNIY